MSQHAGPGSFTIGLPHPSRPLITQEPTDVVRIIFVGVVHLLQEPDLNLRLVAKGRLVL